MVHILSYNTLLGLNFSQAKQSGNTVFLEVRQDSIQIPAKKVIVFNTLNLFDMGFWVMKSDIGMDLGMFYAIITKSCDVATNT